MIKYSILVLVFLIGCSKKIPMKLSHISSDNPVLFYFTQNDKNCLWNIYFPDEGKRKVFTKTIGECPKNLRWNFKKKEAIYSRDRKPYVLNFSGTPTEKELPRYNPEEDGTWSRSYFYSAKTSKLRHVYFIDIGMKNVIQDGDKYFFKYKGQEIDASDGYFGWGTPWLAVLVEKNDQGWKTLAVKPTASEAGETLDMKVLGNEIKEHSDYMHSSLADYCSEYCLDKILTPTLIKNLGKAFNLEGNKKDDVNDLFHLPYNNRFSLYFNTVFGDGPHASHPVYFCTKDCEKMIKIKDKLHNQIRVSVNRKWVLIGYEYPLTSGVWLYKGAKEKADIYLKDAMSAFWLPYEI